MSVQAAVLVASVLTVSVDLLMALVYAGKAMALDVAASSLVGVPVPMVCWDLVLSRVPVFTAMAVRQHQQPLPKALECLQRVAQRVAMGSMRGRLRATLVVPLVKALAAAQV